MESSGEGSPAKYHKCVLHVTLVKAQNLLGLDSNGLSDPYVEVHTGGQQHILLGPRIVAFILRICRRIRVMDLDVGCVKGFRI